MTWLYEIEPTGPALLAYYREQADSLSLDVDSDIVDPRDAIAALEALADIVTSLSDELNEWRAA